MGIFNERNHQPQLVYAWMKEKIKIGDLVKDSQGDIGLVVEIGGRHYGGRAIIVGVLLTERHKYLYGKKYHWALEKLEKLS